MHRVLHAFRRRNNVDEAFVFVSFESALHELSLSFNEDCWNLRIILKCHRYTVLYQSFSIIIPVKTVNMQANMNVKITMYQVKLCHLLHSYLLLKRRKL